MSKTGQNLPSDPSRITAEAILQTYRNGGSLREACDTHGATRFVFYQALRRWPDLKARYIEAQEDKAEDVIDEVVETLTDDVSDPRRMRVKTDIRFALAKVWNRPRYGDQIEVNGHQTIDLRAALSQRQAAIMLPSHDPAVALDSQVIDVEAIPLAAPTDNKSVTLQPADIFEGLDDADPPGGGPAGGGAKDAGDRRGNGDP